MASHTPDTFKPLLATLVARPSSFTPADIQLALKHILTPDGAAPAQIGAFLAALHLSRADLRPDILAAAATALRAVARPAVVESYSEDFVVDIVGTGGDGHNTFNVSTTAAVVAAGAGARVCKHGSRASTSSSGSADLLQSLGCILPAPSTPSNLTPLPIPRIPFNFLLAPTFHPALALVAPTRKALPFRTLFNFLGPLLNPARPKGLVVGVSDPALGPAFAEALRAGGVTRALVVCGGAGAAGLDEVSCAGPTQAWELHADGNVVQTELHPTADFGLPVHALPKVAGGTPPQNAETFRVLLDPGVEGKERDEEALAPIRDFVVMNAAALLVVAGVTADYKDGVARALESIKSGRAWKAFEAFRLECARAAKEQVESVAEGSK